METNFLFTEKQSFRQWWLVTMLAALNILFIYACIQQIGMGIQFGDKPMSNAGLLVTTVVMLIFTAAFFNMGLPLKSPAPAFTTAFLRFMSGINFIAGPTSVPGKSGNMNLSANLAVGGLKATVPVPLIQYPAIPGLK